MRDFLEGYKLRAEADDALQLAGFNPVASDGDLAHSVVPAVLAQPAGGPGALNPSAPSSPSPEPDRSLDTGDWRVLWIERTETRFSTEAEATAEYFTEQRLGKQVSRPGLTVSNFLQYRCGNHWHTAQKAVRPEWMLSQ